MLLKYFHQTSYSIDINYSSYIIGIGLTLTHWSSMVIYCSIQESMKKGQHGHKATPSIWFRFELTPITVKYWLRSVPIYQFLTYVWCQVTVFTELSGLGYPACSVAWGWQHLHPGFVTFPNFKGIWFAKGHKNNATDSRLIHPWYICDQKSTVQPELYGLKLWNNRFLLS